VKQIHHEELEDGDKERPSASPKIMLKQTDSGIQQLHGAGERTQDQQRRRRLLVDRPQCEQSSGIVRAAAYIANSNDASVGTDSAGTRYCGRMIAAMETPLATRTLIAVTSEASQIAFLVVSDSFSLSTLVIDMNFLSFVVMLRAVGSPPTHLGPVFS
jgi:hypothetical protein